MLVIAIHTRTHHQQTKRSEQREAYDSGGEVELVVFEGREGVRVSQSEIHRNDQKTHLHTDDAKLSHQGPPPGGIRRATVIRF